MMEKRRDQLKNKQKSFVLRSLRGREGQILGFIILSTNRKSDKENSLELIDPRVVSTKSVSQIDSFERTLVEEFSFISERDCLIFS